MSLYYIALHYKVLPQLKNITQKSSDIKAACYVLSGTKDLADFNIKLLFSDVCKKRNDEGLEEYYSLGTTATTRYS